MRTDVIYSALEEANYEESADFDSDVDNWE